MKTSVPKILIASWFFAASAQALTLNEAHESAVKNAEVVAISEASMRSAESEYRRRIGAVTPLLSLQATELIQDVPPATTGTGGSVQQTFVRRSTPEIALTLDYTFFSGFREFAGLASSKLTIEERKYTRERAVQLLYADVAHAFYNVLRLQSELDLLSGRGNILGTRVKDLRQFERLGRSRQSERVTVEADSKRLEADIEFIKGQLEVYRAMLSFLTGINDPKPAFEASDEIGAAPSKEECLKDISLRPDLQAQESAYRASLKQLQFEEGDYWPTASLQAHYYPYRVGFREDIDWDVGFLLNWPLFQGGETRATIAKSRWDSRQSELVLGQAKRQAKNEIEARWNEVRASVARLNALREAVALNEQNYRLQSKEYRLGLVTNLDVLSSLSSLYESKIAVEVTRYDGKIQMAQLAVARGKIPVNIK